jgi:hypothetical protein
VQIITATLEEERQRLRGCKAELAAALQTHADLRYTSNDCKNVRRFCLYQVSFDTCADLRARLEQSEKELRLVSKLADSEKHQLLEAVQWERQQAEDAGKEKLLALKAALESEVRALKKDRMSLEANLCDEIARHVITQAQLEKESSQGKTLNTSCAALSQEVAWMRKQLSELEVALNSSDQQATLRQQALEDKQHSLSEARTAHEVTNRQLAASLSHTDILASQISALHTDLSLTRSSSAEHAAHAEVLRSRVEALEAQEREREQEEASSSRSLDERVSQLFVLVASVEALLSKSMGGATDGKHRLRQAQQQVDLVHLRVEHGRQELAMRAETGM